ncbi:transmembrane protein 5 [Platysternon megacephalum]|uniref:Transmembrane protein 5 n=1 Tax=Platysternon megacephalum TaxID=55544 RepID=A0A4D9EDI3_9SAUR|nr:transmembrane protein 5 [Platysternon megacephalum]
MTFSIFWPCPMTVWQTLGSCKNLRVQSAFVLARSFQSKYECKKQRPKVKRRLLVRTYFPQDCEKGSLPKDFIPQADTEPTNTFTRESSEEMLPPLSPAYKAGSASKLKSNHPISAFDKQGPGKSCLLRVG